MRLPWCAPLAAASAGTPPGNACWLPAELGCSLVEWQWEGWKQEGGNGGAAQERDSGGGAKVGTKVVCSASLLPQAAGCELVESIQSRALDSLILFDEQSLVKAKILLLDLFPVFFSST